MQAGLSSITLVVLCEGLKKGVKKWWIMLGEVNGISGIGVRTAHNTPCTSTKKPLRSRFPQTSVSSAKQRKTTEIANMLS